MMVGRHGTIRAATTALVGVLALTAMASPVTLGSSDPQTCQVRNVTQGTTGRSFAAMVAATRDGDELRVRSTCLTRDVVIEVELTIMGVGDRRAVLDARRVGRVLRVMPGTVVLLRHITAQGGRAVAASGGGIWNHGDLTLIDTVIQGNKVRYAENGRGIRNEGRRPCGASPA